MLPLHAGQLRNAIANTNIYSNGYSYGDNWRNAVSDANLRARRDSRSLGYGPGGSTASLPLWWCE